MHTFITSALFLSAAAGLAQYGAAQSTTTMTASTTGSSAAATHTVQVGEGGFSYAPDSVTAAVGSILEFHFHSNGLHSVVQGSFANPCKDMSGGIYSGFPADDNVFQVTVNNTDTMWLYCSALGHCQGGMAMVVNQAGSDTLAAYKTAAQNSGGSTAPQNVQGGVIVAANSLSSGGSTASASTSASGSPTATTSTTGSSTSAAGAAHNLQNIALAVGIPALALLI